MEARVVSVFLCEMTPAAKIDGVPAFVCAHCGERVFGADVAERLDEIRDGFGHPDHVESLDVYNFAASTTPAAKSRRGA
jgi:hypothetical protein